MEKCIFSVIMPCYNSAAYVDTAIESIITQTYPHWELVIVNDGSKDNTLDIINGYAATDNRIKVVSKENGGYATAVNHGLDHITGDYFLFLGSDDRLGLDLFEKLYEQIELQNEYPDMVAFRTRKVVNGVIGELDHYTNFNKVSFHHCSFKEFVEKDIVNSSIFSNRDTSRCYKRELLGETRYFGKSGMDSDGIFSMLLCHKAHTFLNVPVDGYFWTLRSDSVSAKPSLAKQLDRISNWHAFYDILERDYKEEITPTEKEYLSIWSHHVVELSSNRKTASEFRKLIKAESKRIQSLAKSINGRTSKSIGITAKAPVLFSLACTAYRKIKSGT